MAIALRNTANAARASVTSLTVTLPVGTVSGDVLFVAVMMESGVAMSLTGLSNATKLGQVTDTGTTTDQAVWVGVSDGATNPTISWGGAAKFVYGVWASYSGVDNSTPVNVFTAITFDDGFDLTPLSLGPVTTTVDQCWAVSVVASVQGATFTPSAGFTEDADTAHLQLVHKLVTPAGSSGASASTPSTSTQLQGMMAALQPPQAGGGSSPRSARARSGLWQMTGTSDYHIGAVQ